MKKGKCMIISWKERKLGEKDECQGEKWMTEGWQTRIKNDKIKKDVSQRRMRLITKVTGER